MSDIVVIIFILFIAYFIGAIPFGVIVGKVWRGVDIRSYGSGGSGATNVLRTLGPKAGSLVLAGDIAKGASITLIARYMLDEEPWLVAAVGTIVVIGHMFPVYIKFKGGKGVATGLGALAVISPPAALIALIGVVIAGVTRYVSLGSILGSSLSLGSLVVFSAFELWGHDRWYLLFAVPVPFLILWSHHANIDRLVRGDESKLENEPVPRRAQRTP